MKAKIKDMTTGAPLPLIVSFALPLMVGNIFQQLYTVVDTMVVARLWVWTLWQRWALRTGCTGCSWA